MKLSRFVVFNPTFGPREEQEALKLLFFWPAHTSVNVQRNDVGLSEALIAFSKTFATAPACAEVVTTLKHVYALHQPEPHYWCVLIAENESTPSAADPKLIEYDERSSLDGVLPALVRHAYDAFHLFAGRMADVVAARGPDALRAALAHYLTPIVDALHVDRANVFDALHGIQFLPVDKNCYLGIQAFVNLAEQALPAVDETAILYREHLVWSGFDQPTTRTLYALLLQRLRLGGTDAQQPSPTFADVDCVQLSDGDGGAPDDADQSVAPLVRGLGDRRLLVWQYDGVVCAWLLRRGAGMRELCDKLRQFAQPHVSAFAPALAQQHALAYAAPVATLGGSSGQAHRYIYFNHMNLALKTSLRSRGRTISASLMRAICDMHADFAKQSNGELMVKTGDDVWLVGRKADHREFVVVFDRVKASSVNVIEVHEEVQRLCSTFFSSIFLTDASV
jgi:hypothetical protein